METRIEIAERFINSHKASNLGAWTPMTLTGDEKLDTIYNNLKEGLYGECRVEVESGEYELEIAGHDSTTGRPQLFTFIDPDHVYHRAVVKHTDGEESSFAFWSKEDAEGFVEEMKHPCTQGCCPAIESKTSTVERVNAHGDVLTTWTITEGIQEKEA